MASKNQDIIATDQNHSDDESIKYVSELIKKLNNSKEVPFENEQEALSFLHKLHDSWVHMGGKAADGKHRNSVRHLKYLLSEKESTVHSLDPKLAGRTRLSINDAKSLIDLYLSNWIYVGPKAMRDVKISDYKPFPKIKIEDVRDTILGYLFSSESARILLPSAESKIDRKSGREIVLENFRRSNALMTVSIGQTFLRSGMDALVNFRNLIDEFWKIDREEPDDRVLIWIVGLGSRNFAHGSALNAFANVESLATLFRALRTMTIPEKRDRWKWLQEKVAIIVGNLRDEEIDRLYSEENIELSGLSSQIGLDVAAEQFLPRSIPTEWGASEEFRSLYGDDFHLLSERTTHTVFFKAKGWNSRPAHDLRYFGYASMPDDERAAWGLELPSPGGAYDQAYQISYVAACRRLGREPAKEMRVHIDPDDALAHLRGLKFAALRLDEFLNLHAGLTL